MSLKCLLFDVDIFILIFIFDHKILGIFRDLVDYNLALIKNCEIFSSNSPNL